MNPRQPASAASSKEELALLELFAELDATFQEVYGVVSTEKGAAYAMRVHVYPAYKRCRDALEAGGVTWGKK